MRARGTQWQGRLLLIVLCVLALSAPARAQTPELGTIEADVLVIDTDRLFSDTAFGKTLRQTYEARREALIASNREIEASLEAEEQALTQRRAEVTPAEFRDLADAFDEKVQQIRRDNERVAQDLERQRETAPLVFLRQIEPVLAQLMRDSRAVAILDARTVLLRIDAIDATARAIAAIDAALGDGKDFVLDAYPSTEAPGD